MSTQRWKILLVEDDEDDYVLARDLLSEVMPGRFELDWINTYDKAVGAWQREAYDVCLVDYRLGPMDGLELVKVMMAGGCQAPVILMTGQGSYDVDVEAMKAGATDYLSKNELNATLLERSIRYAIERKQSELALSAANRKLGDANAALRKAHDELEQRVQERTEELRAANAELRAEIGERKRAQEALGASEARFRKLAETTSSAIFIVHEGAIRYANPAARIITGYTPDELATMMFWEVAHPAYQEVIKRRGIGYQWTTLDAGDHVDLVPSRYELKVLTKQKQERWVDVTVGQIEYEGQPALVVTAFDITERDLAEQALRKAKSELEERVAARTAELQHANAQLEQVNQQLTYELSERRRAAEERERLLAQIAQEQARLKTIIANAPEGIVVADSMSRIVMANPAAERLFIRPIPYGEPYTSHASLELRDANNRLYDPMDLPLTRTALYGETLSNVEMNILLPDGGKRQLLMNTTPLSGGDGDLTGAIAIFQDISKRNQEEEERRSNLARIEVQSRLMEHREKERLVIAQEIHDGPLQEMIGITFMLNSTLDRIRSETDLHLRLLNIQSALQKQIRELRAFSSELRPPTLTPFGLEKAIRSHVENNQIKSPNLEFVLDLQQDGKLLPEEIRLALFRIYQEALNNVIRHSKASQVRVSFAIEDQQVTLEIKDNGCGFEPPADWIDIARAGHFGLVGARERAEAVGGEITIESQKGKGTRIHVVAPVALPVG